MFVANLMLVGDRKRKFFENASLSRKISTKDNLKLRWLERLAAAHLPSANFIFEITFPDVDSMRFEAIPRSIHYAEDSDEFMECFVVRNVMPFFSNVLYNGDILLRVNGQSLLRKSLNGEFIDPQKSSSCFENIATAAQSSLAATPPSGVTIRFMRSGSTSLNFTPSPAELNLFQVDKHIAAKLLVAKVAPSAAVSSSGAAGTVAKPTTGEQEQQQQWSIQLSYLDPQLPSSISQMMLGGSVNWDHTLLLSRNDSTALAQCTQASMLVSATGAQGTSSGPGAFYAPNGAPAGLSDSWVVPAASLYTHSNADQSNEPGFVTVSVAVRALMNIPADADKSKSSSTTATGTASVGAGKSVVPNKTAAAESAETAGTAEEAVTTELQAGGRVYLLDATTLSSGITGTSGSVNIGATTAGSSVLAYSAGAVGAGGSGGLHGSSSYAGNMSLAGVSGAAGYGGAGKLNKEAGRWVAVLEVAMASNGDNSAHEGSVQQFNLGRFDREQDAKLALDQAIKEARETKQFRPKHFLTRLSAAYTAAVTAAYQQQQQLLQQSSAAKPVSSVTGSAPNKFLSMQQAAAAQRAGTASGNSSAANMSALLAQANSVACVGEASCGFGSVAKVVLAPGGVHTSSSSSNISALAQAHAMKK